MTADRRLAVALGAASLAVVAGALTCGESGSGSGENARADAGRDACQVSRLPGGEWGVARVIGSDEAGDATLARVAANRIGHVFVAWTQYGANGFNVVARRFTPESGWQDAVTVETTPQSSWRSRIGVDDLGNAIAVWVHSDGAQSFIWANRYKVGEGWGAASAIEAEDVGDLGGPELAVPGDGRAPVGWSRYDGQRYNIHVGAFPASGFSPAMRIANSAAGDAGSLQLAVGGGRAIAAWVQHEGDRRKVFVSRSTDGLNWGEGAQIQLDGDGQGFEPHVAIDGTGVGIVTWKETDAAGNDRIWAADCLLAAACGGVQAVGAIGATGRADGPAIAANGSGTAVIVWAQSDGNHAGIFFSRRGPGEGWPPASEISDPSPGDARTPEVAIDDRGNATVVWAGIENQVGWAWALRLPIKGDAVLGAIGAEPGPIADPRVAVDGQGNATAVWGQSDGARFHVWANQYRIASDACADLPEMSR